MEWFGKYGSNWNMMVVNGHSCAYPPFDFMSGDLLAPLKLRVNKEPRKRCIDMMYNI